MPNDNEIVYKEIPGHFGYRVGTDGSVWSRRQAGQIKGQKGRGGSYLTDEWRQLSPNTDKLRRKHVHLPVKDKVTGKTKYPAVFVHRLVLLTFVGPCPYGMECCHYDGNPSNNNLVNLRWDTRKENRKDQLRHGTYPRGVGNANARLTEEIVLKMRQEYAEGGTSFEKIGEKYGVHFVTAWEAIKGRKWKHVQNSGVANV